MKEVKNTLIEQLQEKAKMRYDNQEWYRDELRKFLSTFTDITTEICKDKVYSFDVSFRGNFIFTVSFRSPQEKVILTDLDSTPLEDSGSVSFNSTTKIGRSFNMNRITKNLVKVMSSIIYKKVEKEDYERRKQALYKTNEQPSGTPVQ